MLETVLDCWDSQKELSGTAKEQQKVESDVSALTRRIRLMEEEDKKSAETLCGTVTKLAMTSKAADAMAYLAWIALVCQVPVTVGTS